MAAEFTSWRYVYPLCKKAIHFTRRVRFDVLISCIEESMAGRVGMGWGGSAAGPGGGVQVAAKWAAK